MSEIAERNPIRLTHAQAMHMLEKYEVTVKKKTPIPEIVRLLENRLLVPVEVHE